MEPRGPTPPTIPALDVSVVVPAYNEAANLRELVPAIVAALDPTPWSFEIIVVDDGSRDDTFQTLRELARSYPVLRGLRLRRNYGQTAAMSAGIDASRGTWIVTMDADQQNDPADIPRLLEVAQQGYDVVSGWRRDRKDPFWNRRLPSQVANWLISKITGVHLHDYGCTLKVYRGEILRQVDLYGELHRFIPALTSWQGAKVTEVVVNHRERKHGRSNYGISRILKVLLDLITVKFLLHFGRHPSRVFGGIGLAALGGGLLTSAAVLVMKFQGGLNINRNPLLYIAIFLFSVGVQLVLMGLLAELVIRAYYEASGERIYHVGEVIEPCGDDG